MSIIRDFTLYLHAGISVPPVVHVNQYDQGEVWRFTLLEEDGSKYTPSTGALIGVKSDGHAIAGVTGTVMGDGRVSITETQQMTAAAGKAVFELTIDGGSHGTANFIVQVEPKPTDGAILSDSDLSIIQEGMNSVTPVVIAETVSDWLEDNLTNPPIDPSLTISNAAADAKVTGDKLTELKTENALLAEGTAVTVLGNAVTAGTDTTGGYWRYINNAWAYVSSTGTQYFHNVEFSVTGGRRYRITGRHANYCPVATFWDANNNIIGSTDDAVYPQTSEDVTKDAIVPENCTKIIVTAFPLAQVPTVTELLYKNNLSDSLRYTKMSGCMVYERLNYPINITWSGNTATIVFPYQFYIAGYDGIHKTITLSSSTSYTKTLTTSNAMIIYDVAQNDVVTADWAAQVTYESGNVIILGYVINGVIYGGLSTKVAVRVTDIENSLDAIKYLKTTGFHLWERTGQRISLKKQGTTVVVTFPYQFYISGSRSNWVLTVTLSNDSTYTKTLTMADNTHAVYNPTTNDVEAKTWADMTTLAASRSDYIFLGTNINGTIFGALGALATEYLEKQVDSVAYPIPYYYDSYMADKVTEIENACAFKEGVAFPFITDIHLRVNAKQSGRLIKYLGEHTNAVPFVVSGGDIPYATDTEANVLADAQSWLEYMTQWGKDKTIQVHGNHDYMCNIEGGGSYRCTVGQLHYYITDNSTILYRPVGVLYGYYDVPSQNVRIIITDDYDIGYNGNTWSGAVGYSTEQLAFIKNAILETNKQILVISHQTSDAAMANYITDQSLQNMLIAAKNKTGDFASWQGDIIMHLSGHSHNDENHVQNNLLSVATVCDAGYTSPSGYTRNTGTTSEQAFDVVCINTEAKTISMIRVGAGSNRSFTY